MTTNADTPAVTLDPRDAQVDVATATDAEKAMLDAGLETGEDGAPIDKPAATPAPDPAAEQAAAEAAAAAERAAADKAAAAAEQARAAAAAAAALPARPTTDRDFAKERTAVDDAYENGDLELKEYLAKRDEITLAQATHTAAVATWEANSAAAAVAANAAFDEVALAWETKHAAFIANPLREKAMQDAIALIDKQTGGGLTPTELFGRAEKVVFEAFNYTPPDGTAAAPAVKTEADLRKEALKDRAPKTDDVPGTLARAPQAAGLDPNNANYTSLDSLSISDLEDRLARMSPEQQEAYLRDAPGASATGRDD